MHDGHRIGLAVMFALTASATLVAWNNGLNVTVNDVADVLHTFFLNVVSEDDN